MGGKRKGESAASGKGMRSETGVSGREGSEMPRVSASISSSRAVITQSVSLTGGPDLNDDLGSQYTSVSSSREASSFLSKHGIIARCQI